MTSFGSIYASGNSRIAQVGTIHAEIAHIGSSNLPAQLLKPNERFSTVTLQRAVHFTDRPALRDKLKAQLHDRLLFAQTDDVVVVVHGFGGVGKTQLVLDYIQRFNRDYRGVFWINCCSQQTVEHDLALMFRLLCDQPGLPMANVPQHEEVLLRIKQWFLNQEGNWLWVLDNADNIDDPQKAEFVDLTQLLPSISPVQALITSRSYAAAKLSSQEAIEVGGLEREQALTLFWKESGLDETAASEETKAVVGSIVEELGYLALAVTLSSSTISESHSLSKDVSLYLQEFRENRRVLLMKKPEWLTSQYTESMFTAWETSFSHLIARSSIAGNLLAFLSMLDSDNICLELFKKAVNSNALESIYVKDGRWQNALSSGSKVDLRIIEAAFSVLRKFSFIQNKGRSGHYTIHKLVQVWAFERLTNESKVDLYLHVALFIDVIATRCSCHYEEMTQLLKHMRKSYQMFLEARNLMSDETFLLLLKQLEMYEAVLCCSRLYSEYKEVAVFDYEQHKNILGDEKKRTLRAMGRFAQCSLSQGRWSESVSIQRQLLEKGKQIDGEEHINTIERMQNLACALLHGDDTNCTYEAASIQSDVMIKLNRKIEELEENESEVLFNAKRLMVRIEHKLGRTDELIPMQRELLQRSQQAKGDDHPSTLSEMDFLIYLIYDAGDKNEAAAMLREIIQKSRKTFGDDHPDTLKRIAKLGFLIDDGNGNEATAKLCGAIRKTRELSGGAWPGSVYSKLLLVHSLYHQGDRREAVSFLREILEDEHGELEEELFVTTKWWLASILRILADDPILEADLSRQDLLSEAISLEQEVVEWRERVFGKEYAGTLTVAEVLSTMNIGLKKEHISEIRDILLAMGYGSSEAHKEHNV